MARLWVAVVPIIADSQEEAEAVANELVSARLGAYRENLIDVDIKCQLWRPNVDQGIVTEAVGKCGYGD